MLASRGSEATAEDAKCPIKRDLIARRLENNILVAGYGAICKRSGWTIPTTMSEVTDDMRPHIVPWVDGMITALVRPHEPASVVSKNAMAEAVDQVSVKLGAYDQA